METRMLPRIITASFLIMGAGRPAMAATTCQGLAALKLPDTTITLAIEVAAGAFLPTGGGQGRGAAAYATLPAFCRVAGVIRPTSDSNIKFEVWMPQAGGNERFQGMGNGGFPGKMR